MVSEFFTFSSLCVVPFRSTLHHIEYLVWYFTWHGHLFPRNLKSTYERAW